LNVAEHRTGDFVIMSIVWRLGPILVTVVMVLYSLIATPWGKYNSPLVYVLLPIPLVVFIWHLALAVLLRPPVFYLGYAVGHLLVFSQIWLYCLIFVSHDSL
jgi:hypothetical protein